MEVFDLDVTQVGVIYMKVTNKAWKKSNVRYPCSSVNYNLSVNSPHYAQICVPVGEPIADRDDASDTDIEPQKLLKWIEEHDEKTNAMFVSCKLYEDRRKIKGSDILIFDGYIVSGSLLYETTGRTGVQVVFDCMGKSALLMSQQLSSYLDVNSASLVNLLQRHELLSERSALNSKNSLVQSYDIMPHVKRVAKGKNLADKISLCVGSMLNAIKYDTTATAESSVQYSDAVNEAIGGTCRLNTAGLDPGCEDEWVDALLKGVQGRMHGGNLFESLLGTLNSYDFALQMVPRWSCDSKHDFRMEVTPVKGWKNSADITVNRKDITSIKLAHNIRDRLSEPEVIIANFGEIYSLTVNDGTSGTMGVFGVYAKNAKLRRQLQTIASGASLREMLDSTKDYKVMQVAVPAWLAIAVTSGDNILWNGRDNRNNAGAIRQSPYPPGVYTMTESGVQLNRTATSDAFSLANKIAELIFIYVYRKWDTAIVTLAPSMRFGLDGTLLENHLGDTIDLKLSKDLIGMNMTLRGSLQTVSYRYSAGQSSGVTYELILNRVRLADADMPVTSNYPIYTW